MVRQKKKGQWEGRIVVGHKENGSPIFRYVYAKTQKELLQKLHQKIDEYKNAELTEESSMTLGEWLDKWLRDFLPGTIRQTTLDGYCRNIKNYIKPNLGDAKFAFITTNDIQKMYNKLKKNGRIKCHPDYGYEFADTTVIKIHTTLHSAMEEAVKNHLIQKNPTDGTKPVKPSSAYYRMKIILKKAGLPSIRFHDMRHTFATHALVSGVDVKTLSEILGHTRPSFMLDAYTHVTSDMKKRASKIVGSFIEDIFGKELQPWEDERTERGA